MRRALGQLRGGLEDADTAEVDSVLALLAGSGTREVTPAGGLVARRSYDRLLIASNSDPTMDSLCAGPPLGPPIVLAVPGTAELPGWHVTAEEAARPSDFSGDPMTAYLDADRLGPAVSVRAWRAGDRIQPLGMRGHRKLQDVFTDARVPAPCRDRIPVLEGSEGIVWVAGLAVSQVYRVMPGTRRVVRLTALRKL
jgi:tRNA(Ile)-lysidine synthase